MRPHSLRVRLLLLSAIGITLALTVAGVVLTALFAHHLEAAQANALVSEFNRLVALIDADEPQPKLRQPMADPRFALPFGGLYWQVSDPVSGSVAHSRSVWEGRLESGPLTESASAPTIARIVDPEGTPALSVGRRLKFDLSDGSSRGLDVVVAEDLSGTEAAIADYRLSLGLALAVLGLALMGAAALQVTAGLAPLRDIQSGINAIRRGESARLGGDFPSEIAPLVQEVNDLAQAQERSIAFARERAADLAHALRTHMQILTSEARRIRLKGDEASAEAIDQLTAEMTSTIDHQLGLARLRARSPHLAGATEVGPPLEKLVEAIRCTERGERLDWQLTVEAGAAASIDPADFLELAGIVLDNAAKWARGRVAIECAVSGEELMLTVEDDGTSLDPEKIALLGGRGVRLDERRSGSGIGLSIAREIADINRGTIAFFPSRLGGLRVVTRLPA
ncbi:MAG TPA: HAMP domain-containing sensor histidine kinase, partial [Devosia sp.]|nr:HAMP domain-containing sensor histidine kinase [Devosia sp.]